MTNTEQKLSNLFYLKKGYIKTSNSVMLNWKDKYNSPFYELIGFMISWNS